MIKLYDFGSESNIKVTLPVEDAENYNKYVTAQEGDDDRQNEDIYKSYITVTTVIGKKSFELNEAGIEATKGGQLYLREAPENDEVASAE